MHTPGLKRENLIYRIHIKASGLKALLLVKLFFVSQNTYDSIYLHDFQKYVQYTQNLYTITYNHNNNTFRYLPYLRL